MNTERQLRIIFTTDIHGNYFPFDFRHQRWGKGSLQRVHAFVAQECQRHTGSTLLIDGGDMLQGEPTSYYFNFVDKSPRHRVADMCNFIGYDAGVMGNHDIETGHHVFDRFIRDCNFPIMGANAVDVETGEPYFQPYTIFYRSGVKIAVIGFVTPAIPHWIPKQVWQGMRFDDIKESAEKWVKVVKEEEHPDFIIGLFHSGMDEGIATEQYKENAVRQTASEVSGFDLILYGHDHAANTEEIVNPDGKSVLCINPGSYAHNVAVVTINFILDDEKNVVDTKIQDYRTHYIGTVRNLHGQEFNKNFFREYQGVSKYASEIIGTFLDDMQIIDAYFGSSSYIDLIQSLQLQVSGADVSFAAPLFFNAVIKAGKVKKSDFFNIYRFEDKLYTLKLTGKEILAYLEMSYDGWISQMSGPDDPLLQTCPMKNNPERIGFKNFIFNFDSASGIHYTVDVSKPMGERITVQCTDDGKPFDLDRVYTCAMTAYRANGGGELLTKGAGIEKDEIDNRIVFTTEHDIRHYMMEYVRSRGDIHPVAKNHWRFIPDEWVSVAAERERAMLFSSAGADDFDNDSVERPDGK